MRKYNLLKKTLVTTLCMCMVLSSMTACGKKKETVDNTSTTVATDENSSTPTQTAKDSIYENAPVAHKDIVDDDIKTWKEIGTIVGCDVKFDYASAGYTQEQLEADAKQLEEIALKFNHIVNSQETFTADISDISARPMTQWITDDGSGTLYQIVYSQVLCIAMASPSEAYVVTAVITNEGKTSYTETSESCYVYTISKNDGAWKITNAANYIDGNHDNMKLTDITLQCIQPDDNEFLNTPSGEKVPFFKIVGRR